MQNVLSKCRAISVTALMITMGFAPGAYAQKQMSTTLTMPAASDKDALADRIVAVVNSDVITSNELRDRVREIESTLTAQGTKIPPRDVIERQVLERMVTDRILLQTAKDDGIRVDDYTVDRAVARIAQDNKLTMTVFRQKVEEAGTPFPKFREDVREGIMRERLRDHEVDSAVQVSEGEIDNYLAEQAGVAADTVELDIAQILIRVPDQATAEQIQRAKDRADEVYAKIQGGADFATTAVSFSNAPDALAGGDLGWRTTDLLPQLYVDAVSSLSPGQTAKPVKSPNGFHVLKLVGRRKPSSAKAAPVIEQTHVRHILIRVNESMSLDQAKARLSDIRARIEAKTDTFEDMARSYSTDASAAKGGDLGFVLPGDTVPEFERAMNLLAINEISEPVVSPYGVHLIQVLERKSKDVPQDRVRLQARQTINQRKADEAYLDWLRAVRDKAYVEIRLDDTHS